MAEVRAGGYVDRGDGKGWVVDDSPPKPPAEPKPHKPLKSPIQSAGGWALTPDPEPEPEPQPKKTAAKKTAAKKSSKSKGDDG